MTKVHGLAASIRATKESQTFDLAGQNVTTITKTIKAAFQEPFSVEKEGMIRLTFLVGAGKTSRQKYNAGAAKAVTSSLTQCGYKEDRGASCVIECGGSFKTQHDTGKNLYTVVVFPKVASGATDTPEDIVPLIPEDSPGYKIAVSSLATFRNMANVKCPSWAQKKECLGCIEALQELLQELDDKLIKGVPLHASEQDFYDSCVSLEEKASLVKEQAQELVEQGKITAYEKEVLLQQNVERIASLEKQQKSTTKAWQRKQLLESIQPIEPPKLKYHTKIGKLYKELVPILKLESDTKGHLLTIKETQLMARKDEILQEMEYLEEASRGWFEDDNVFASRVEACRKELASQHGSRRTESKASRATIDASTKVRVSANKWMTPGSQGFGAKGGSKKSKQKLGGSLFGAMTMDSSSDEETEVVETTLPNVKSTSDAADGSEPSGGSMRKNKAGKKRSKKKKKVSQLPREDEVVPSADAQGGTEMSVATHLIAFLQTYLLPLITALLGWLVRLVFGKKKKQ